MGRHHAPLVARQQKQVRTIHEVRLSLSHIRVGTGQYYWYVRYTDNVGKRQKVYLGKYLPPDGQIEDRIRKHSPHLFPSPFPTTLDDLCELGEEAWWQVGHINTIFRCCRCGKHPTDNPLFVICDACRRIITEPTHFNRQSGFRHQQKSY